MENILLEQHMTSIKSTMEKKRNFLSRKQNAVVQVTNKVDIFIMRDINIMQCVNS